MSKKIYNKNAREKALLEEAYSNVYKEQVNQEVVVGAQVMWDGQRKRGQVEEVDLENGVAVVYDEDGGEHIVELDNFDVVLNPEDNEQVNQEVVVGAQVMWDGQRKRGQVEEVDVENRVAVVYDEDGGEHIVELDNFDVVLNPEDNEDADRTADATAWAKRQNEKQDLEKMPDLGPHSPGHKRFRNPEEIADWAKKHLGEDEDAEMEFDERGFAKNTEAGREGEGSGFKVGDWVWDDEGMHASIVNIDGDEIDLFDGKEGWTVSQSEISHEQRDHDDGKYSREPSNYPGQPGAQY